MTLQPQPSDPTSRQAVLARLSADPATQPGLRAGDADRDLVREALTQAFSLGRLTREEHLERLDALSGARTVGQLFALVDDVLTDRPGWPAAPAAGVAPAVQPARRNAALARAGQTWLFVAIITNVIWVLTGLGDYYWPIWPMFGTAIPVLAALIYGGGDRNATRHQTRDQRRQERGERRAVERGRRRDG